MNGFDIVLITNGPGELATWVRPVARQIAAKLPAARLLVALVPCPYASGGEMQMARQLPGVSAVLSPQETMQYLLLKRLPADVRLASNGVNIFLGGDQFFAVLFKWRNGFTTLAYTEKAVRWPKQLDLYLLTDQSNYVQQRLRLRGISPQKLTVVGNLMIDAVQPTLTPIEVRNRLNLSTRHPIVSLLPGSKPFKVRYMTSFFLRVADLIAQTIPNLQFILHQSPFTPLAHLAESVRKEEYLRISGGSRGELLAAAGETWLISEAGTRVRIVPPEWQYEAMQVADLALTVPGTNTAELAVLGVPMIVTLPLNKPEVIPLDGLLGRLGDVPWLGRFIKQQVIEYHRKTIRLTALPNQRVGYMLTPELVGVLTPDRVSTDAGRLLNDPERRRQIAIRLRRSMGEPGGARRVVEQICRILTDVAIASFGVSPSVTPSQKIDWEK